MTIVKVTCPECGDVDISGSSVCVYRKRVSKPYAYGFTCPRCALHWIKNATPAIVSSLIQAGVVVLVVPAEVEEFKSETQPTSDELREALDRLTRAVTLEDLFA
jgi:predicted RNA-binding Zn-ribbon protein involved in translation (DUF1610 family)